MRLIVVDTNILFSDPLLDHPTSQRVLDHVARTNDRDFALPELVIDEIYGKATESIDQAHRDRQKADRSLAKWDPGADPEPEVQSPEAATQRYQEGLKQRIADEDLILLPLPAIGHEAVVQRALDRRKPFDAKGRSGYRDTLIWHSVLEQLNAGYEAVDLVSADKRAFAGESGELASELREELTALGYDSTAVVLHASLRSLWDGALADEVQTVVGEYEPTDQIESLLASALGDAVEGMDLQDDADELLLPFEGDFEILDGEFEPAVIEDIIQLSEKVYVEGSSSGQLRIDAFLHKSEWYSYDEHAPPFEFDVWDTDWNEWYVAGTIVVPADVQFVATISESTNEIDLIEVVDIRLN